MTGSKPEINECLSLPTDLHTQPLMQDSVLISGSLQQPAREGTWNGLMIPGLRRRMALALHSLFVSSPTWSETLTDIPDQGQFLLWEETDGHGILVPVLDGDFRACMCGSENGLALKASCGPSGTPSSEVALAVAAFGEDPYETIKRGMSAAIQWMGRGKERTQKQVPEWVELFGWNTWDAFYSDLNEEKMLKGLETFQEGGIVPGQMVIDEGWQDYDDDDYLTGYGVKENAFTDDSLRPFVQKAKNEYGVKLVGCWHTLFGELRGIDPEEPEFADLNPRLVVESGTEDDTFGVPEMNRVPDFFETYHSRLEEQSVDFVKVDFQGALYRMTWDECGRAEAARRWQNALQNSVEKHFDGQMLNCMCLTSDQTYHTHTSNVTRASDDFFPDRPETHPDHLRQCAYNSLWLEACTLPDWDMFHSQHPWGRYHALARAVSGGPVYVSDKPGEHDFPLLQQLVAADNKILRADDPALPTRDILFRDPESTDRLLKVFSRNGTIGLLGVFHPQTLKDGSTIEEAVEASLVETVDGDRFAVHSATRGFIGVRQMDEGIDVSLAPGEADVLVFSPVNEGFAPVGLVDKLNPAAGVLSREDGENTVQLEIRGGGRFGAAIERDVETVKLNGETVDCTQEGPFATIPTGERPRCTLSFAFTE